MTTSPVPATTGLIEDSLLHWRLERGMDALMCEVRKRDGRFDVQLTLASSNLQVLTQHFDSPTAAVECHASVTATLMDAGWIVTAHTADDAVVTS